MYDLDLEKLDKADDMEAAGMVESLYKEAPYYQLRLAYLWMQNIHFGMGDQHIYFNQVTKQYELLPTTRQNDFIPRPTTNLIQGAITTMVSNFAKNKPTANVSPNSPNEQDISAAMVAGKIQDLKWEEDEMEEKLIEAMYWALNCGTVFRKDYWDTSYGKTVQVPLTQMVPHQELDPITGQIIISQKEEPVVDETGSPQFFQAPLGDNSVDIIDPFRMFVDPNGSNDSSISWIMETSIQKIFWIKENFMHQEPGYTGLADQVKEESSISSLLDLRQRLKALSNRSGSFTGSSGPVDSYVKNAAIVKELYIRPTREHPKGQMLVVANNKMLYRGDAPDYDGSPNSWHPYTVYRWEIVPGRYWGKSYVEDLIEPQRRLNAIDSLVILNRKTMAAPQRLIPDGSGVPKGYWSGAPGLNIPYRPVGANGAKPELLQGMSLPAQVYQEREVTKNEFMQISRTNEILQGIRPPGTTYQSMQLLLEQTVSALAPQVHRWEKWIEKGESKKLKLIAMRYREPRMEFINKLRAMNKDISDVDIINFIGADLRNNCQVRVEAGSTAPRSNVAKQQQLMEIAQTGVLGDLVHDPVNKQEFLERMGVKGFDVNFEGDFKRASWENEMLDNGSFGGIMVLPIDNHQMHIEIHGNRVKEPAFMKADPQIQQAYQLHIQQHMQDVQQQQIQQAQQQALMQGNLPANQSDDYLNRKSPSDGAPPEEGHQAA